MAYETTSVDPTKSQGDIRDILNKHDATGFRFSEHLEGEQWVLTVEFIKEGHLIRIQAMVDEPDEKVIREKAKRARKRTRQQIEDEFREQEHRRMWRVLYWSLKARMEAIEEGLETFVQAFLPHVVDPGSGQTIWQRMQGHIEGGSLLIDGPGLPGLPMGDGDNLVGPR